MVKGGEGEDEGAGGEGEDEKSYGEVAGSEEIGGPGVCCCIVSLLTDGKMRQRIGQTHSRAR